MRVAFKVIAIEKHSEEALIKAESESGDYLHVKLTGSELATLGFTRVPVEQVKAGDKMIDVPIENGGQWKWAASKTDDGALVIPPLTIVVEVSAAPSGG